MITDLPGVRVGHATDPEGRTGCTVVLFPEGTVASGEVRGGAPATREVALLDPTRTVARLDALVLSGGSAFGLAAADGVVRFCEERGMGVPTPAGPVPIVVGLSLFDLAVGDPRARPGPDDGYAACEAATTGPVELGTVGAGTGATVGPAPPTGAPAQPTVGPFRGIGEPSSEGTEERAQATGAPARVSGDGRAPGGLVAAGVTAGGVSVAALVAVNAAGAPGADDASAVDAAAARAAGRPAPGSALFGNTTIGVVVTDAPLDKLGCHLVAQGAHDGLARALFPAHTRADGDAFVVASVPGGPAPGRPVDVDTVRSLAVHVVSRALATLAG
ncbi:MAG TPA: P1 family peptidase [Acidimicrobiales bacterium]